MDKYKEVSHHASSIVSPAAFDGDKPIYHVQPISLYIYQMLARILCSFFRVKLSSSQFVN